MLSSYDASGLERILDEGLEQNAPLILVCGPAGYGKTTAVSEWLQTSQKLSLDRVAWLTLERGDDDLTRFLTYFVTALQRIQPGIWRGGAQDPAVSQTLAGRGPGDTAHQ